MERPLGGVHLIADFDVLDALPEPLDRIRALLDAGLPSLQVRAHGRPAAERFERSRRIADLARRAGALFVVNGDPDLAAALGADGLHVSARAPTVARARVPPACRVGMSCHDRTEIERARGADWIFLSPVFPTGSKPGASPLGAEGFARLAAAAGMPCYALGGIDSSRAASCFDAGAAGVAAIRGLLGPGGEELVRIAMDRVAADD